MDREELKKSVLINLRCVTQSCKEGVPLNKLQREYKDLLGSEIPVKDLGYSSLEQFLHSIPDVIRLKKNKEGTLSAEGVADASTAHIANLVSRQKNSKKSKSKFGRPSVSTRKLGNSIKVTSQENQKHSSVNFHNISPSTCSKTRRRISGSAQLNHEQKQQKKSVLMNLRSVVQSSKRGVPISHLQRDYKKFIGTMIPFKYLGYNSLEEFIQSIPKVISVKRDVNGQLVAAAVPDATTAHLFNSASKQKSKKTKVLQSKASPKHLVEDAATIQISSQKNTEIPSVFQLTQNSVETSSTNEVHQEPSLKAVATTHIDQCAPKAVELSKCETTKENKQENNNVLKKSMLGYLKSKIQNSGGSLPLNMIPDIYKHDVGSNIPFEIFGFNSLENFILSLLDDFNLKKDKNGELFVETVPEVSAECVKNLVSEKKSKIAKPHRQTQPKYVPPMFRSKISSTAMSVPAVSSSSRIYIPPPLRKQSQNEVTKSTTYTTKSELTFETNHIKDQIKNHAFIPESRKAKKRIKDDCFSSSSSVCESLALESLGNEAGNFKNSHSSPSTDVSNTQLNKKMPNYERIRRRKREKSCQLETEEATLSDSPEVDNGIFTAPCDGLHVTRGINHPLTPNQNVFNTSNLESFKPNVEKDSPSSNLSALLHLHFLLYGVSSMDMLKNEVLSFTGFPFDADSEEWKEKISLASKLSKKTLKQCLTLLCIEHDVLDDKKILLSKLENHLEVYTKLKTPLIKIKEEK